MQTPTVDLAVHVNAPIVTVFAQPAADARCTSEALYGEVIEVLAKQGDWLEIRQQRDGYKGFVEARHLTKPDSSASPVNSHWVSQRSTLLFQQADLKSPLSHRIPFGSELALSDTTTHSFSKTACGHYVWTAHCLPLSESHPANPLELASSLFLGSPYLWGGRSPAGIDCSGLVQALARSQGITLPRDSGDQEVWLQTDVEADDYRAMDLVFWPGHTGILISTDQILHATAHTLNCLIEPLDDVISRAGPVSSVKRIF
ncbi:C40 family peptidase [Granulosicoccus antarcticus]|uniref:Gamma-D-glutamyl-L-lysine endopeptidase n=1 Tax=Granulosicoccus antarcticus IMCC3135 TaxID=1192854 RepID=A0A2Z2NI95_9GAMM|nr:C40 family peptidase [Granulosicoccus antarcticus]ASJ70195.1 Gamma-D-glutamyl-L-lysine endopeptidase [Granulosicoccus antarcticus IMCC3135]